MEISPVSTAVNPLSYMDLAKSAGEAESRGVEAGNQSIQLVQKTIDQKNQMTIAEMDDQTKRMGIMAQMDSARAQVQLGYAQITGELQRQKLQIAGQLAQTNLHNSFGLEKTVMDNDSAIKVATISHQAQMLEYQFKMTQLDATHTANTGALGIYKDPNLSTDEKRQQILSHYSNPLTDDSFGKSLLGTLDKGDAKDKVAAAMNYKLAKQYGLDIPAQTGSPDVDKAQSQDVVDNFMKVKPALDQNGIISSAMKAKMPGLINNVYSAINNGIVTQGKDGSLTVADPNSAAAKSLLGDLYGAAYSNAGSTQQTALNSAINSARFAGELKGLVNKADDKTIDLAGSIAGTSIVTDNRQIWMHGLDSGASVKDTMAKIGANDTYNAYIKQGYTPTEIKDAMVMSAKIQQTDFAAINVYLKKAGQQGLGMAQRLPGSPQFGRDAFLDALGHHQTDMLNDAFTSIKSGLGGTASLFNSLGGINAYINMSPTEQAAYQGAAGNAGTIEGGTLNIPR